MPSDAAGMGGELGGGDFGGEGGRGEAGAPVGGADAGCEPEEPGVTVYNGFDGGVDGPGFSSAEVAADVDTTLKATTSALWDSQEGSRCPGSLRLSCAFKGYASGAAADEKGFMNYFFDRRDWSAAAALHAMVRVSPSAPPISGVRLFVLSGDNYLYHSVLDATAFKNGGWNEMRLPLQSDTYYDPTKVHRIGVEVALLRSGSPGIPATPPVVDVWVDDIWLEPK